MHRPQGTAKSSERSKQPPSLGVRAARGSFWLLSTRLLVNTTSFGSTLLLARMLAPADFGLVALGTTMMAILTAVTDISVVSALVQHPDPTDEHLNTAWSLNMVRGLIVAFILAAAAKPISWIYGDVRIVGVTISLSVALALNGLVNPRIAMLQRELVFSWQFILEVTQRLVATFVSVTAAFLYHNYWALVVGLIGGQLASTFLSYIILPFRPRVSFRYAADFFGFSLWLTLGQIVNTLNWRFDQLIVGYISGRAGLGYYTVGDGIAALPTREIVTPLTSALFPALRKFTHDKHALGRAYQSAQALITATVLPLGVGTALIAEPLVRLIMGSQWIPAIFMIQALASVYAIQTLGTLSQALAMAAGETRLLFVRDMQSFLLRVPFVIGGVLAGGIVGIVYARILTGTFIIYFNMRIVEKITGITLLRQLSACVRSFASVAVMALAVSIAGRIDASHAVPIQLFEQILKSAVVGGLTYIGTHYLLWLVLGRPLGPEVSVLRLLNLGSGRGHSAS